MTAPQHEQRRYWLDKPENVRTVIRVLIVFCAVAMSGSLLYQSHGPFSVEHVFGFFGIFGFVACVALVLVAKWMRTFLMRPEEYYDPHDDD